MPVLSVWDTSKFVGVRGDKWLDDEHVFEGGGPMGRSAVELTTEIPGTLAQVVGPPGSFAIAALSSIDLAALPFSPAKETA